RKPAKQPCPRSTASSCARTRSPISARRSALPGDVAAQPFLTGGRPDLGDLVERLEGRLAGRQWQPWQLASREDVHVGLDLFGVVQGADPNEQCVAWRGVILAP